MNRMELISSCSGSGGGTGVGEASHFNDATERDRLCSRGKLDNWSTAAADIMTH